MTTSFSALPDSSKIWIFPASRKLYPQELPEIEERLSEFLATWPHNHENATTAFQLFYKHFIIIGIDSSAAELDLNDHDRLSSFIQQLEKDFNILLMDRINITYKQGEYVQYKDPEAFKKMIKNRSISKKTIVFDNMIDTKEGLDYDWEIPITESWLSRLLPK